MKLTNLSLSILVALGLIACGGSDDNNNAAADNNNAGHQQGGKGGSGGVPQEEKKPEQTNNDDKKDDQKSGLDPERKTPDLKVPADLVDIVNSRKKKIINRGFSDNALGYKNDGKEYEGKFSTDPGDVKHTSIYNYVDQDDIISKDGDPAKGAISLGADPKTAAVINAWAKGKNGIYYRVELKDKTKYNKSSKFQIVDLAANKGEFGSGADNISQSKIVFIANSKPDANVKTIDLDNPQDGDYTDDLSQVVIDAVSVNGKTYSASSTGQELDISQLPVKKEIQVLPVTGDYSIINTKGTPVSTDDKVITDSINLGYLKAYNLPYSTAYVTTNSSKKGPKDIFRFGTAAGSVNGAYQVVGYKTVAQPKDGRAFYTGKAFGATTVGDVDLVADFFADRAGISGVVKNRKDLVKDKDLQELTLGYVSLVTDDGKHVVDWGMGSASGARYGDVTGDSDYANRWSGSLYGLDAQEVSGTISKDGEIVEVFGTQRKVLTNHSNDAATK